MNGMVVNEWNSDVLSSILGSRTRGGWNTKLCCQSSSVVSTSRTRLCHRLSCHFCLAVHRQSFHLQSALWLTWIDSQLTGDSACRWLCLSAPSSSLLSSDADWCSRKEKSLTVLKLDPVLLTSVTGCLLSACELYFTQRPHAISLLMLMLMSVNSPELRLC